MSKRLFAVLATAAAAASPVGAATVTLTSAGGGAIFEGTFASTYPLTTFAFTGALIGPASGLPVSFSAQFVGQSTYDSRYCTPTGNGPTSCGVFSDFSGPSESFTLAASTGSFVYNLPTGFVTLRGNLAFSPTSGASVLVNAPGSAVPEPAGWALLVAGFAMTGAALRRHRMPARA